MNGLGGRFYESKYVKIHRVFTVTAMQKFECLKNAEKVLPLRKQSDIIETLRVSGLKIPAGGVTETALALSVFRRKITAVDEQSAG